VRLGPSVKLGYFAQQSLDILDDKLTVWEQIDHTFPLDTIGQKRNLLGAFQFSGDDVEKRVAVLSAASARGSCSRRCSTTRRTSSCSTSRPTTST
jgi:ATPase subunit of ABC transporter with duplicated ATPase domains